MLRIDLLITLIMATFVIIGIILFQNPALLEWLYVKKYDLFSIVLFPIVFWNLIIFVLSDDGDHFVSPRAKHISIYSAIILICLMFFPD